MKNLSLNLGPKLDSDIDMGAAEMASVVWLLRVEETSRSRPTPGAEDMRLDDAEDIALVGEGHGNEEATDSSGMHGKSEVGERGVTPPEAGEKGASRPGDRGKAGSRVLLR